MPLFVSRVCLDEFPSVEDSSYTAPVVPRVGGWPVLYICCSELGRELVELRREDGNFLSKAVVPERVHTCRCCAAAQPWPGHTPLQRSRFTSAFAEQSKVQRAINVHLLLCRKRNQEC